MKRFQIVMIAISVLLIFGSSCYSSTDKATTSTTPSEESAPASTENVDQAIRQLVNERDQAIMKGDTAAIERIYSDDYLSTSTTGAVRTKAQVIDDFKSGTLKIESFNSDEVNVRVLGDTAIVTGKSTIKGQDGARDISGQNRFTQVYMKRNDKWQIVAFHISSIPQQ